MTKRATAPRNASATAPALDYGLPWLGFDQVMVPLLGSFRVPATRRPDLGDGSFFVWACPCGGEHKIVRVAGADGEGWPIIRDATADAAPLLGAKVKQAKRTAKRQAKAQRDAILRAAVEPVDWRAQRRALLEDKAPGVQRHAEQLKDSQGRTSAPHRVHDTLSALGRAGALSKAQEDAGRRFQKNWELVQSETLRAPPLDRMPGAKGMPTTLYGEVTARALDETRRAVRAIGGTSQPPGAVAWLVLAEGLYLRDAAARLPDLPNGKQGERAAKWLLVAALGVLAVHYGFARPIQHLDRDPRHGAQDARSR